MKVQDDATGQTMSGGKVGGVKRDSRGMPQIDIYDMGFREPKPRPDGQVRVRNSKDVETIVPRYELGGIGI